MKTKDRVASKAYRQFLHSGVCDCGCGRYPCDPAHVISRKRADGSDLTCVKLYRECHREFDDAGVNKIQWLEQRSGRRLFDIQQANQRAFRALYQLPEGDFETVLRVAGMIEPPYTRRKNRLPFTKFFRPL